MNATTTKTAPTGPECTIGCPGDPKHADCDEHAKRATPTACRAHVDPTAPKRPRGFAAMSPERVREIASKGGSAAHAAGTAHQFTTEEARAAGKKGGVAPHVSRGRQARKTPTGRGLAVLPSDVVDGRVVTEPPSTTEAGGAE